MFFLETKDGDKFFTDKNTDDTKEFGKIVEDKMGKDAAELYDTLITEHDDTAQEVLNSLRNRYNECIKRLDTIVDKKPVDTAKLEEVLCDLQQLYLDYLY